MSRLQIMETKDLRPNSHAIDIAGNQFTIVNIELARTRPNYVKLDLVSSGETKDEVSMLFPEDKPVIAILI
jgi:hypothetical protein